MSKVKPILYMLGKGGISVLQTAIFDKVSVSIFLITFILFYITGNLREIIQECYKIVEHTV